MRSSYIKNIFAEIFEHIIKTYRSRNIVELGILDGYSMLHLAKAIAFNKKHFNIIGHLDAYDLFEEYKFKRGNMQKVQSLLNKNNLQDFVTLHKADAFKVHKNYADKSIHLLHVDLSNTGDIVKKIMKQWNDKILFNGIILFEGGSIERDNVGWMKEYSMSSIRHEIKTNEIINNNYIHSIYEKFPSLTMLIKK